MTTFTEKDFMASTEQLEKMRIDYIDEDETIIFQIAMQSILSKYK